MKERIKVLFIGNSHTYVNCLPNYVTGYAERAGVECESVMIAHGGWYLKRHISEEEVRFNIAFGKYDYVVLQEHGHPLPSKEEYISSVMTLADMVRNAGSVPVLYGTWAHRDHPEEQPERLITEREVAGNAGCLPALVGEGWFEFRGRDPENDVYSSDGGHASERGSAYAAEVIWNTIYKDLCKKEKN